MENAGTGRNGAAVSNQNQTVEGQGQKGKEKGRQRKRCVCKKEGKSLFECRMPVDDYAFSCCLRT